MTRYTIERLPDGRVDVLCDGESIGTADVPEKAAGIAAADALSEDRDDYPDVVYDMAAEIGQMVGNVRHLRFFREAVAEAIAAEWPEAVSVLAPAC
ncbi:hypothetical protein BHAOGJBA_4432 [Methylobacterium hispanicum]|uniref:Uncharacterized protein n=1 Tax=Methylobacterium hispanicum TaxID=270350 RepID=A0AAV4ZSN9_9HYPH|nr:hypothetical protein [Methylobacterium hispanicum]GJD90888.1 hypothetical protein BHAOGJBA_4432 [Methylobacterium hispanicum]